MRAQTKRPTLLWDPDSQFLKRVKNEAKLGRLPIEVVTTAKEACQKLTKAKALFSSIILNPLERGAPSVLRSAYRHQLGVPLFAIYEDSKNTLPEDASSQLGFRSELIKPIDYFDIESLLQPIIDAFDYPKTSFRPSISKEIEVLGSDRHFSPILIENFLPGYRSFFEVYIRLGSGRYLKILNEGDTFGAERILNYIKRGAKKLYIRREVQLQYLAYCDHLAKGLLKTPQAPKQLKTHQVYNLGEETLKALQERGIEPELLQYAKNFIATLNRVLGELNLKEHRDVQRFLKDIDRYQHGVATTIIAALLSKAFHFESERWMKRVALASFLHDVSLNRLLPKFNEEWGVERLSPREFQIYKRHPEESAKILSSISGIDVAIVQAVEQHHERRDGLGFPGKTNNHTIFRMAEVVGISDELVNLISQREMRDPFSAIQVQFDGFSYPIIEAFKKTFIVR